MEVLTYGSGMQRRGEGEEGRKGSMRGEGGATSLPRARWIATLHHKLRHNSVEHSIVVVALLSMSVLVTTRFTTWKYMS
jgi:hypothetical protein